MLIMLIRTQLVLLSISNFLGAVLCLPRLSLLQELEPTAKLAKLPNLMPNSQPSGTCIPTGIMDTTLQDLT